MLYRVDVGEGLAVILFTTRDQAVLVNVQEDGVVTHERRCRRRQGRQVCQKIAERSAGFVVIPAAESP